MITFPNAKINLGLYITAKRSDGYHNIETIFYPIPLEDALEVNELPTAPAGSKWVFHATGLPIAGLPEDNLVVKAYQLLDSDYSLPPVEIWLYKRIPSGAGLGGGSSDAAHMLKMLNDRFALALTDDELERYAARLGADCPFFVRNKPTLATGIGNLFTPVSLSLSGYQLVVIKPDVFVSTREAFARIQPRQTGVSIREVIEHPVETWRHTLSNDFEQSVFAQHPALGVLKEQLYRQGAVYAAMSGSGSALFGLFSPDMPCKSLRARFPSPSFYTRLTNRL
ncbi:MAG: 4-(cytidine 5'-diphospho)-2-C-methyl-D-erythritol kinase [Prevotellaceae bacterium]|jgi:4-diphosphocytidyl-2-C-methyl-D-erythritol kinase|nr:4-(cytidine 5'-diphospho)-2-C-methyl-D-erythritol kinase [Prevotellaceae bacterium]